MCQTIKICPAELIKVKETVDVKADPALCSLCQFVVQYAETLLKSNATEQQIIKKLGMNHFISL